ncbi:MAG: hypothetical protein JWM31_3411 [Solirubrobacterales bacterium]|nr:hypothetical protein [Solirubrobacterales bacterium]
MSTRELALFLHLLGVLTMVAGIAIAGVMHRLARRADRVTDVVVLLRAARTGVLLAVPGVLLLLIAGWWLIHLEHLSLDVRWLRDAIGLVVFAAIFGAAGGRTPRRARGLAEQLQATGGSVTPELRGLLDDRVAMLANVAASAALLGVLWLMVAKPG